MISIYLKPPTHDSELFEISDFIHRINYGTRLESKIKVAKSSKKNVKLGGFRAPGFHEEGTSQILDMHLQTALTSEHVADFG